MNATVQEPVNYEAVGASMKALAKFDKMLVPGAVKIAIEEAGAKSADLWKVPLDQIVVMEGYNIRIRDDELEAHIEGLKDSIKAVGFWPHSVLAGYIANEGGRHVIYLTDGHCRLEAVLRANKEGCEIKSLPMVMNNKNTSVELLTASLLTKASGKKLSTFERAIGVSRLADFGWDHDMIHQKTGVPLQEIDGLLMLMAAPAELRNLVATGKVAAGVAVTEMKSKGSGAVDSIKQMQAVAKAKGHAKVTERAREGAAVRKVIRKEGENMLSALRQLRQDPAYDVVGESLKKLLADLLEKFEKAASKEQAIVSKGTAKSGQQDEKLSEGARELVGF